MPLQLCLFCVLTKCIDDPCWSELAFCGLQLGEEVSFEQLSESWTCKPQHVRLHQVAILLGRYPRLLLNQVLSPSCPPPPHRLVP